MDTAARNISRRTVERLGPKHLESMLRFSAEHALTCKPRLGGSSLVVARCLVLPSRHLGHALKLGRWSRQAQLHPESGGELRLQVAVALDQLDWPPICRERGPCRAVGVDCGFPG